MVRRDVGLIGRVVGRVAGIRLLRLVAREDDIRPDIELRQTVVVDADPPAVRGGGVAADDGIARNGRRPRAIRCPR